MDTHPPTNPFRELVQGVNHGGRLTLRLGAMVRIIRDEEDPEATHLPILIAFLAAEALVRAWWPRRSKAERESTAIYLARKYDWKMGLLFAAVRDDQPPLRWRVLNALRPVAWRLGKDGFPVAPLSPVQLVTRERVLEAEIAARRAGGSAAADL